MAVLLVIIVPGAIEIGGHQAESIKAMLFAKSFTELDSSNFGDRITFVCALKRTS